VADTRGHPGSRLLPILVLAAVLAVSACSGGDGQEGQAEEAVGLRRTPMPELEDLGFLDHAEAPAGVPFRVAGEEGGFLLFYFGYLTCPDVCPLTLGHLSQATGDLPPELAAKVSVGLVTIDPARDEGAEIADYMTHFMAPGRYHALRAADRATLREAGDRVGATWRREGETPSGSYFMAHTAAVYVVDDEGSVVWEFPYGTQPDDITDALVALDAEARV
jgi:protein SCO1/2